MDHRRNPPRHTLTRKLTAGLWLCLLAATASAATLGQQQFLPVDEAFVPDAWVEGDAITLAWRIAPGYYLYRHGFAAIIDGETVDADYPDGEAKVDDYFGEVEVYHDQVFATVPAAQVDADAVREVTVRYQGCAEAGLCYPPVERTVQLQGTR